MKSIITLFLLLTAYLAMGQDPHFTNYNNTPLQLNAALTGQISGSKWRINTGIRDQWQTLANQGAFRTAYIAADRKFCVDFWDEGDYLGAGLQIIGDERGNIPLQRVDALLSGAFVKKLGVARNGQHFSMGLGGEAGLISYRLGDERLTFDEDFGKDPNDLPPLDFYENSFMMPDFGLGFSAALTGREVTDFGFQAGFAIKHLNSPEYQFINNETASNARLNRRYNGHLTLTSGPINNNAALLFRTVYSDQKPSKQLLTEIGLIHKLKKNDFATFGVGTRFADSINGLLVDVGFVTTKVVVQNFNFTLTYEHNISPLRNGTQHLAAVELTVGVLFGQTDCVRCPRY